MAECLEGKRGRAIIVRSQSCLVSRLFAPVWPRRHMECLVASKTRAADRARFIPLFNNAILSGCSTRLLLLKEVLKQEMKPK